jgi:DNA-binding transcriptional LysR family regulator
MDFDDLSTFLLVLEHGGFSRAATQLGVSKSIVSRRITQLEAALGARLLSRTTRKISPTAAGLEFKNHASRILDELEAAREKIIHGQSEVSGELRLAAPLSFGIERLAPAIAAFAKLHPKLGIDLAYSDRYIDLVAECFDAAVRIGVLKDSSLISRKICTIKSVLVASPDYLAAYGEPETPQALLRHECLIYSGASQGTSWAFQQGQRRILIHPNGRFRADNGEALRAAAIASLGIASLPDFLVHRALAEGTLRAVFKEMPLNERGLYLLRPKGGPAPAKLRALYEHLLGWFVSKLADPA